MEIQEIHLPFEASTNKPHETSRWLKRAKQVLWEKDLHFKRSGPQAILLFVLAAAAMLLEICFHDQALSIPETLKAAHITIFYNVKELILAEVPTPVASMLVMAGVARILFSIVIGVADVICYKRITGRPFDWEAMITMCVVNLVFILTILFTFMNPAVQSGLDAYEHLVSHVPTLPISMG